MARICPSLPPRKALGAGEYAELDLLTTLERGLSDAYTLFHSVDWSRGSGAYGYRAASHNWHTSHRG